MSDSNIETETSQLVRSYSCQEAACQPDSQGSAGLTLPDSGSVNVDAVLLTQDALRWDSIHGMLYLG